MPKTTRWPWSFINTSSCAPRIPKNERSAQKYIALIQFENLQDFNQAVLEFEKLLKLEHQSGGGAFAYRLNMAKSQLPTEQHRSSRDRTRYFARAKALPRRKVFEARIPKGQHPDRRETACPTRWWRGRKFLRNFPKNQQKENVALNLVVCYEELKDFGKAIDVLEGMREGYAHPEFLDVRIQRLKRAHGQSARRPRPKEVKWARELSF